MGYSIIESGRVSRWRLGGAIACAAALLAFGSPVASAHSRSVAPITIGVTEGGFEHNASALDTYAQRAGARPGIVMWYDDFQWPLFTMTEASDANAVVSRGALPMITWAPAYDDGSRAKPITDADVAAGKYDAYLIESARQVRSWGKPLLIRFAHEMNGNWDPWDRGVNGNSATSYIAMWRHVVTLFRQQGASNVQWVWAPNVNYQNHFPFTDLYPGDAYVDWVGLDGYNGQSAGWASFADIFSSSYRALSALTTRPMMITETASFEGASSSAKAAWIRTAFLSTIPTALPRVRAVIWFDRDKERDWRVQSSTASLAAWRAVVASPLYTSMPPVLSAGSGSSSARFGVSQQALRASR
jgi:hypothetical protein